MESYFVRIYRRKEGNPQEIAGTVEEVITSNIRAFKSLGELKDLFLTPTDHISSGARTDHQEISVTEKAEDTL